MPSLPALAPGDASRDHDVSKELRVPGSAPRQARGGLSLSSLDCARDDPELVEGSKAGVRGAGCGIRRPGSVCRKRQDIGGGVLVTVLRIEFVNVGISDERDGYVATNARRAHGRQPACESAVPHGTAAAV